MIILSLMLLSSVLTSNGSEYIPKSGDVVRIGDIAEFVLVSAADYERLYTTVTNLKSRFDRANSSESGRVMFHGKKKHTTVNPETKETEYEDGYIHEEKIPAKGRSSESNDRAMTPWELRKEAIRKRRANALSKTNEVSVIVNR